MQIQLTITTPIDIYSASYEEKKYILNNSTWRKEKCYLKN